MPALKGNQMGGNYLAGKVCHGCGANRGEDHRPDCTVEPGQIRCTASGCPAVREAGVTEPVWVVRGHPRGYLCPEHFSGRMRS